MLLHFIKLFGFVTAVLKRTPALALLAGAYFYIIFILLSYDHAWMHIEQGAIKQGILSHGVKLSVSDLKLGQDYQLFEYAPRFTRPLSSYFEIVDTKFRVILWKYFFPHPSLSLTWLFTLVLSPWLLYRFLRKWSVDMNTALCGVCLYMMNPGVLSLVAMLFRPSKAMTNFSILLCLNAGAEISARYRQDDRTSPGWDFWAFTGLMFVSFFWDETALLIYPAVYLFSYGFWKNKFRRMTFLLIPVAVALMYFVVLPGLARWAGYAPVRHLGDWAFSFYEGSVWSRFKLFAEYVRELYTNFAGLLFKDSFGLVPLHPSAPGIAKILVSLSGIALAVLVVTVLRNLYDYHARRILNAGFYREMAVWAVGLLALVTLHVLLMCLFRQLVWGLFWYGTYWPVFFSIFLARIFYFARINRYVLTVITGVIAVNCGLVFPALNNSVKNYQYYHKFNYQELVRTGRMLRFDPQYGPVYSGVELMQTVAQMRECEHDQGQKGLPFPSSYPLELKGLWIEIVAGCK